MPQLLRDNTRNLDGGFAPVLAVVFTAKQRSQKLRVEPRGFTAEMIVSCRRLIFREELLGKAFCQQPRTNILLPDRQVGGCGDVGIQRGQSAVGQFLCMRVQAIELVRPTADDYDLVEPGLERRDESFERGRILSAIHRCFSSSGLRTRRRISSDCSCPRAGCAEVSSQTCRASDTGRPSRTTAARKMDSLLEGTRI